MVPAQANVRPPNVALRFYTHSLYNIITNIRLKLKQDPNAVNSRATEKSMFPQEAEVAEEHPPLRAAAKTLEFGY